ncbi:hypothetical protein, partial [Pseudomonas aeruginosa]|uniref:hypothetical protein n=1 Tax=Pseudomonas aeruginosa TaxID=287 RepID=UPI001C7D2A0C
EAWSWRSVASGNTQLAAGAEVGSWWSGSSGTTQLVDGAEVSSLAECFQWKHPARHRCRGQDLAE